MAEKSIREVVAEASHYSDHTRVDIVGGKLIWLHGQTGVFLPVRIDPWIINDEDSRLLDFVHQPELSNHEDLLFLLFLFRLCK